MKSNPKKSTYIPYSRAMIGNYIRGLKIGDSFNVKTAQERTAVNQVSSVLVENDVIAFKIKTRKIAEGWACIAIPLSETKERTKQ